MATKTILGIGLAALAALIVASPALAHGVFGPALGVATRAGHAWGMGHGMMGHGTMGGMVGDEDMHGYGPMAGYDHHGEYGEENVTITGVVEDRFHMMLEVEAQNGEEVEVMLHHWWKVTLPDGETVEMPGWELVENYIHEGEPIVVQGHEFEGHGHCMGGEESELHLVAYSIELPGQGITATPG